MIDNLANAVATLLRDVDELDMDVDDDIKGGRFGAEEDHNWWAVIGSATQEF